MNTVESNEMIAQFMGATKQIIPKGGLHGYKEHTVLWMSIFSSNPDPIAHLSFDCDWDWLMPVVEKIESLGFNTESEGWLNNHFFTVLKVTSENSSSGHEIEQIVNGASKNKMDAAYKTCIAFIEWYNQQPK